MLRASCCLTRDLLNFMSQIPSAVGLLFDARERKKIFMNVRLQSVAGSSEDGLEGGGRVLDAQPSDAVFLLPLIR